MSSSSTTTTTDGFPELLAVRNALYLGNYSVCMSKIAQTKINESNAEMKMERDVLSFRAHIGLGQYDLVLQQIKESDNLAIPLRGVRLLSEYFQAQNRGTSREAIIEKVDTLQQDPSFTTDPTFAICSATIYAFEGNDIACLKSLHDVSTLEAFSLRVRTLIRMNRIDLAEHTFNKMMELNEDATITNFTRAYVALAKGTKDKISEAESIFKELSEKFGQSVPLLNGIALCLMHDFEFADAENTLLSSLALSTNSVETLVNLIACSMHLNKDASRFLSQLQSTSPNHPWVVKYNSLSDTFDSLTTK
ncbi:hypothetical protein FDP41_009335 [Naegleria fowleri]|uniref:Coatomer subunit epsilon n=1 Tax=Naegleria fowleri TaxID=5763 RepID=A0A6A5BC00_NAEFO|nr:uncharacterized protein FDP41_009335 [Naegleria fowleri]KAF0972432.1 hypothetical protein FDP41_009335 [Naegleria fowleri]CAG4717599.1 unnamed protein product [Naegleria fowleri]